MYRNRIVTPEGTFEFNESDLNVPLLIGRPHNNNSKNYIAITSSQYNNLMFVPNSKTNKNFKKSTFRGYGLSLSAVRDRIFQQFIENSINILEPANRRAARANFEIYDKNYRELLQRARSRTLMPTKTAYNTSIPVGGKRKRS